MTLARLGFFGQMSRSNTKNGALTSLLPSFEVKVGVKVMGQSQRSRSNFWRAVVDNRDSALLNAAESKEESFVCVLIDCADAVFFL